MQEEASDLGGMSKDGITRYSKNYWVEGCGMLTGSLPRGYNELELLRRR
jgi:hypothetical protein